MTTTTGVGSAPPPSRLLSGLYYPEDVNGRIVIGDGVGDGTSDLIQRDIIYAKAPNKIVNILDVLLVWLRGQQYFEHPSAAVNLAYVTQLLERRNTLSHNRDLPRTVIDILHTNRSCRTGVNGTFIALDRDELAFIVKDRPVFL
jgi:hypothetical protein